MTGGVVYVLTDDRAGLTREAVERRIAAGARVRVVAPSEDEPDLVELLGAYRRALSDAEQFAEAEWVDRLIEEAPSRFVKLVPVRGARPLPVAAGHETTLVPSAP